MEPKRFHVAELGRRPQRVDALFYAPTNCRLDEAAADPAPAATRGDSEQSEARLLPRQAPQGHKACAALSILGHQARMIKDTAHGILDPLRV